MDLLQRLGDLLLDGQLLFVDVDDLGVFLKVFLVPVRSLTDDLIDTHPEIGQFFRRQIAFQFYVRCLRNLHSAEHVSAKHAEISGTVLFRFRKEQFRFVIQFIQKCFFRLIKDTVMTHVLIIECQAAERALVQSSGLVIDQFAIAGRARHDLLQVLFITLMIRCIRLTL